MIDAIEIVALAIEGEMFAPHELPLDAELHQKYRQTAKTAIDAMVSMEDSPFAQDRQLPRPNADGIEAGWQIDYAWLCAEADAIEKATGYQITLECLQEALLRNCAPYTTKEKS